MTATTPESESALPDPAAPPRQGSGLAAAASRWRLTPMPPEAARPGRVAPTRSQVSSLSCGRFIDRRETTARCAEVGRLSLVQACRYPLHLAVVGVVAQVELQHLVR